MSGLFRLGADATWLLLTAMVLAGVYFSVRWVVTLLPLTPRWRRAMARIMPTVGLVALMIYLGYAVRRIFADAPAYAPLAYLCVAAGIVAALWASVRDAASGVVLKAAGRCRVGDHIEIDGCEGTVRSLGLMGVSLETSTGDESIVPYSTMARATLIRKPATGFTATRVFEVLGPTAMSVADVQHTVRQAALLSHWSSTARTPTVSVLADGKLKVTVYPLASERGVDVEQAVRRALGEEVGERTFSETENVHPDALKSSS